MNPSDHRILLVEQFSKQAAPFARHHDADRELMEWSMNLIQPKSDGRYLDVACGPGIISRAVAKKVRHMTGIDVVPQMITEAQLGQKREGLENLDWIMGDATSMPFESATFDGVITRFSFHHFPEPIQVLAEMKRVCKPKGSVVVIDASPKESQQEFYDQIEQLRDPSHTSALTESQFLKLGQDVGLTVQTTARFELPTQLDRLLNASFPPEGNADRIRERHRVDIETGTDRHGMKPHLEADDIWFMFPIFGIVWTV